MDTVAVRKRYGKNVIICGNVDKRALARGKAAIDGEIERCRVLLQLGGFFPSCDHHVPPDVPLENIVYFCNELRKLSAFPETRRVVTL
jgi:uroporphyrinogen decarboxylase